MASKERWPKASAAGVPKEFALYLRYSLGSIQESETRLQDGIDRAYFSKSECRQAFIWATRCSRATAGLWRSQERRAREDEDRARKERKVRRKQEDDSKAGSDDERSEDEAI